MKEIKIKLGVVECNKGLSSLSSLTALTQFSGCTNSDYYPNRGHKSRVEDQDRGVRIKKKNRSRSQGQVSIQFNINSITIYVGVGYLKFRI